MAIVEPDKIMIAVAFVFLILSSLCQVLVPKYTGAVLDSLVDHINGNTTTFLVEDTGYIAHGSVARIPGFAKNIELLVAVALLGGVFGGLRGSIFTVSLFRLHFVQEWRNTHGFRYQFYFASSFFSLLARK